MSNETQQEIAAPTQVCKPYSPYLLLAFIAMIVTATFGLSIFAFAIIDIVAVAFLPTIILAIIPVRHCLLHNVVRPLLILFFYAVLGVLLAVLAGVNYNNVVDTSIICFALIALVSVYIFAVNSANRLSVAATFFGVIICVSLIIMMFFLNEGNVLGKAVLFDSRAQIVIGICVLSIVTIALICLAFCLPFINRQAMTSRYITYAATFVALSILCKTIGNSFSYMAVFKFTFVYVPWVLSGIVLGPIGGMITAGMSDLIGQLIVPTGGAPVPLLLLSNTIMPLFPALAYKFIKLDKKYDKIKILIGMTVALFVCTLGISTYSLSQLFGVPFVVQFTQRLPQILIVGVNYAIIIALLPVLDRAKIKKIQA